MCYDDFLKFQQLRPVSGSPAIVLIERFGEAFEGGL